MQVRLFATVFRENYTKPPSTPSYTSKARRFPTIDLLPLMRQKEDRQTDILGPVLRVSFRSPNFIFPERVFFLRKTSLQEGSTVLVSKPGKGRTWDFLHMEMSHKGKGNPKKDKNPCPRVNSPSEGKSNLLAVRTQRDLAKLLITFSRILNKRSRRVPKQQIHVPKRHNPRAGPCSLSLSDNSGLVSSSCS
jgi:hypothetical protein